MSVSKKLIDLAEQGHHVYLNGIDTDVEPLIIAVIEAAEAIRYAVEPLTTPPPTPLGDALDALEEALT